MNSYQEALDTIDTLINQVDGFEAWSSTEKREHHEAMDYLRGLPELDETNLYKWQEVKRIAEEMLDTTHGLMVSQKDRYANYLKMLADTIIISSPAEDSQSPQPQEGEYVANAEESNRLVKGIAALQGSRIEGVVFGDPIDSPQPCPECGGVASGMG